MRSTLKKKLVSGEPTIGCWITIGHPTVAEILARVGFDWLVVDLEHSTMSMETAGELIRVIDLCGCTPLVRLSSNDPDQIKRVMDGGSAGIIVPMVNTPDAAERAVAATRYAPRGSRGVGLARAQQYGPGFEEYLRWQYEQPVVIVQIEHRDALAQLDRILAVPDVDGFIVGPYDLSCSLGVAGRFESEEFVATMRAILEAGTRARCAPGIHIVEPEPDHFKQAVAEGYRLIAYSADMRLLDVSARLGLGRAVDLFRNLSSARR